MLTSTFLAKLIGPFLFTISISLFLNRAFIKELAAEFEKSAAVFYLTGILNLLLGLIIISVHNIWVAAWQGLITLIGWMAFVKGVSFLLFPEKSRTFVALFKNDQWYAVGSIVCFILGGYLTYVSYIA